MSDIKKQLIRLGNTNPELRSDIRPILASLEKLDMRLVVYAAPKAPAREPKWLTEIAGLRSTSRISRISVSEIMNGTTNGDLLERVAKKFAGEDEVIAIYLTCADKGLRGTVHQQANLVFDSSQKLYGGDSGASGEPIVLKWSTWSPKWRFTRPSPLVE